MTTLLLKVVRNALFLQPEMAELMAKWPEDIADQQRGMVLKARYVLLWCCFVYLAK